MNSSTLVDTNALLRLLQPAHAHYPVASAAIGNLRQRNIDLCIVPQNLVEFWAVATRPLVDNGLGMTSPLIAAEVRGVRNLFRLLEGASGIADEWEKLVTKHGVSGKQAHDAHLVAAMHIHGISCILTFNGADFKRYGTVDIVEPFLVAAS